MHQESRTGLAEKLAELTTKLQKRICDPMIDFWNLYQAMSSEDRQLLKTWINQVVPLARSPVSNLMGRLHVELRFPTGPGEEIRVEGVPAQMIQKAIEHWERGEKFDDMTLEDLGL